MTGQGLSVVRTEDISEERVVDNPQTARLQQEGR